MSAFRTARERARDGLRRDPAFRESRAACFFVLIDPEVSWTVGEDGYESRSYNNCFGGRELTGRVLMTVAAGRVAFRQRSFALGVAS